MSSISAPYQITLSLHASFVIQKKIDKTFSLNVPLFVSLLKKSPHSTLYFDNDASYKWYLEWPCRSLRLSPPPHLASLQQPQSQYFYSEYDVFFYWQFYLFATMSIYMYVYECYSQNHNRDNFWYQQCLGQEQYREGWLENEADLTQICILQTWLQLI